MKAFIKDLWSNRRLCWSLSAIVSTLALMPLVAAVPTVFADHAIGTQAQIAWQARLLEADEAMARGDLVAAERQWRAAYAAALKSRHWQGMVAAGDAYRALGARAGFRASSVAKARQAYLTALFRARAEGSVEGLLRTADRFAELGDRDVVERCIRVARQVAKSLHNPQAKEYVRAFTERWAADAHGSDYRGLTP